MTPLDRGSPLPSGPDKKLKLSMTYQMNVGHNHAEVVCALDARQTTSGKGVTTLANLTPGSDVFIPLWMTDKAAKPKESHCKSAPPCLRMTTLPS